MEAWRPPFLYFSTKFTKIETKTAKCTCLAKYIHGLLKGLFGEGRPPASLLCCFPVNNYPNLWRNHPGGGQTRQNCQKYTKLPKIHHFTPFCQNFGPGTGKWHTWVPEAPTCGIQIDGNTTFPDPKLSHFTTEMHRFGQKW